MKSERQPEIRGWFDIPGRHKGKTEIARQLRGLAIVRGEASGATVLDLGCAEALVALDLAKAGASLVHGVELDDYRVAAATKFFASEVPQVPSYFWTYDLSKFDDLALNLTPDSAHGEPCLRTRYDIVLCLAIAQKLPNPARFLRLASILCEKVMAVRLSYPVLDDIRSGNVKVDIRRMLAPEFDLIQETDAFPGDITVPYRQGDYGWLGIFSRRTVA